MHRSAPWLRGIWCQRSVGQKVREKGRTPGLSRCWHAPVGKDSSLLAALRPPAKRTLAMRNMWRHTGICVIRGSWSGTLHGKQSPHYENFFLYWFSSSLGNTAQIDCPCCTLLWPSPAHQLKFLSIFFLYLIGRQEYLQWPALCRWVRGCKWLERFGMEHETPLSLLYQFPGLILHSVHSP